MAKTRVTLIGCGFTGTTLGLALKNVIKGIEVVGNDKDREAVKRAEQAKAIDRGEWNIPSACNNAAAVLITGGVEEYELVLKAIGADAQSGTLVATIGGANATALRLASTYLPTDVPFFATSLIFHPERVNAANLMGATPTGDAEALKDAIWTIAPRSGTNPDQVDIFTALVTETGARPVFVDPIERDGLGVGVDTLPPVLSSLMMLALSGDSAWRDRQWMAGAQFGAAMSNLEAAAQMAQTLVSQPDAAIHWLNQIMLQCMALRDAVRERDEKTTREMLTQAKDKRDQWLADWRRGRDDGRQPIQKQSNMLGMFLGERMAGRLANNKKR